MQSITRILRQPGVLPFLALLAVGVDTLGIYLYLSQRDYLLNPVWIYLTFYTALFLLYAYAGGRIIPKIDVRHTKAAAVMIVVCGVLFRAAVLPAPPSLSTDMYRYVWDGKVAVHGINPYRWAPNAPQLRPLRDSMWSVTEYKAYQTIYMPVSQAFFAGNYVLFGHNLIGYKAVYASLDAGVVLMILAMLKRLKRPLTSVIWYAWCPLPITEVALAGHQDVVGVFFLMLAFLLVVRRGSVNRIAVALTCAILTKGFALLLIPLFWRRYGKAFLVPSIISLSILSLPLVACLPEFLHGMQQYLKTVHVNSGLFQWMDMALSHITVAHSQVAAMISNAAIVAVAIWSVRRPVNTDQELLRRSFIVLAATLMVVPTLFPWYLVWVTPFLCLIGRRPSWAFVLLVCLIGLLYTYYISIQFQWWTPVLEYAPFYLVLAWEYWVWRNRRRNPDGQLPFVGDSLAQRMTMMLAEAVRQEPNKA
ncbi:hypothetical protein CCAX7_34380 [Capsulimonas corticalis]|uniref:Uncharacterized protein n=1 Tax=Capsulimonas corticalis TaxID=2219043 RepID=A0A402CYG0_9BACT|nr:hypothetical protein [Capsulimonas corticalis]BDI31387.1 hypothetical protein CCAX7_34380 [Capsulimonas corticalis]